MKSQILTFPTWAVDCNSIFSGFRELLIPSIQTKTQKLEVNLTSFSKFLIDDHEYQKDDQADLFSALGCM